MNFHVCLESAIDYIEENLDGEIDYEKAAQKAFCSAYHFQRMFSYIVGVPLSEYIRRRRMTLAAFELQKGDVKVVDLAVKYGYDSQSSFARAFQAYHGRTPSSARDAGAVIKAYPRISLHIFVGGSEEMDYRIEKTEPFSLFGVAISLRAEETRMDSIFDRIGTYADQVLEDGSHDATNAAAGQAKETLLTAVRFDFVRDGACKFMFAAEMPEGGVGDGFTTLEIPATTWAVFPYRQVYYPETNEPLYRRIYEEWFPTSGYEQAAGPCLERFPDDRTEAWIPIKPKG